MMNSIDYPFGETLPKIGETYEVAPGVKWLRMRLPFALDHINLWLLRDHFNGRDGWTVVDCGIHNEETKATWREIFQGQLEGLPILRVIVTHMHPDHIGLADWLCNEWQAPLWISLSDFLMARWLSSKEGGISIGSVAGGGGSADHFQRHGLHDEEDLEKIRARADYYSTHVPSVPYRYRRILENETIEIGGKLWRAISGYGHAPEHLAFHCQELKLLISGDMVLPRISTNVSVYDAEPDADPLGLYLDSLTKYENLDLLTLVLPSHGKPFTGLNFRISQLREHHKDRLDDTLNACKAPITARDVIPHLFKRPLDNHQLTFAMGETIAHLNYLWIRGRLIRETSSSGLVSFSQPFSLQT